LGNVGILWRSFSKKRVLSFLEIDVFKLKKIKIKKRKLKTSIISVINVMHQ